MNKVYYLPKFQEPADKLPKIPEIREIRDNTMTSLTPTNNFSLNIKNTDRSNTRLDDGIIGMIPYIGDALSIGQIGIDLKDKNYKQAIIGAGLFLVPNFLEKTIAKPLLNSIKSFKRRNLRMTHVSDLRDLLSNASRGEKSLITPSFSVYKNNGRNLFMYNIKTPVIFFGNRKLITDPNYIQFKGDIGTPFIDNMDFSKTNRQISQDYVDLFGKDLREKSVDFDEAAKQVERVNYNEGKYLGEYNYDMSPFVLGPENTDFINIMSQYNIPYKTYPINFLSLDKNELRSQLQNLIEDFYKSNKDLKLKQGGTLDENDSNRN